MAKVEKLHIFSKITINSRSSKSFYIKVTFGIFLLRIGFEKKLSKLKPDIS